MTRDMGYLQDLANIVNQVTMPFTDVLDFHCHSALSGLSRPRWDHSPHDVQDFRGAMRCQKILDHSCLQLFFVSWDFDPSPWRLPGRGSGMACGALRMRSQQWDGPG